MKKYCKKRILFALLVIVWMVTIFCFSNENGETSQGTSDIITNAIININEGLEKNREIISFCVRKLAHFSIYFVGGILLFEFYNTFEVADKRVFGMSALTGISYACFDEFHQLFISGRSGQFRDVCIDSTGIIVALIIMIVIANKCKKIKKNTSKKEGE